MVKSFYPEFLSEQKVAEAFGKYERLPCGFSSRLMSSCNLRQDLTTDSQRLAALSSNRIYTEWTLDEQNGAGKDFNKHKNYNGEAFGKFLEDEKYFSALRGKYVDMDEVLNAFVRSAFDFFIQRCDWNNMKPIGQVNIRRNLANWIDNPSRVLFSRD